MKYPADTLVNNHPIVSDGMSQQQRALPALAEGYFNVDEMRIADLLTMAVDYARVVKFRNMDNRDDGDWKSFFSTDETVIIAAILATDLSRHESAFERLWSEEGENGQAFMRDIPLEKQPTYTLAALLNHWFVSLGPVESTVGSDLRALLGSMIGRLRGEIAKFEALHAQFSENPQQTKNAFAEAFDALWFETVDRNGSGVVAEDAGKVDVSFSCKANFYAFLKAVEMVQKSAEKWFAASMTNQTHDPAAGLLIAFLQLYQRLKKKINRYTHNHLDFYYDKVLMSRPQAPTPDSTYLVLQAIASHKEVPIEEGTEFVAGTDAEKRDIIYVAANGMLVNDAQVSALHTLYFNRDRMSSPENMLTETLLDGATRQFPTGFWKNAIPVTAGTVLTAREKPRSHPLLGAPKASPDAPCYPAARIGFALSSKVLALREGQRRVSITLKFGETAADMGGDLETRINDLMNAQHVPKDKAASGRLAVDDIFFRAFRHMFVIGVTAESGWLDVPEYVPMYSGISNTCEKNSLMISFELAPHFPPVTPYSRAIHGENYDTGLPLVRFIINPDNYLYPYGLLRNLPLKEAVITVDVAGCKELALYNDVGQLSPATPFNPFGPIPVVGSYFIVGSAEAACKRLTSFDIDVEWGGLPAVRGGFEAYYQGYEAVADGEAVVASVSTLTDGKWTPGDNARQAPVTLFDKWDDERDIDGIAPYRTLSANQIIHYYKPLDRLPAAEAFTYTPSSKNGFFKFTLSGPSFVFGHKDYPLVLAHALTYNSRQKVTALQKTVPNPPYTPLVNSISLNYKAFSSIRLDQPDASADREGEKFIHLHPLGWEVQGDAGYSHVPLIPQYDYAGNLYIGFDATRMAGPLNLFFHLREDSLPLEDAAGAALCWSYLAANRWVAFKKNQLVSDSTQGFMVSGVVTLEVPPDIDKDHTVMPSGICWIRVSAEHNLDKFCSMYAVYANGLKVSRRQSDELSSAPVTLPAATIQRSKKTIPGLGKITQIIESFGGRPIESRSHLRTRTSERLRHKNRAVSPRDYETLILERFPEIYKVKCFPNMVADNGPKKCIRPGHTLIVALPHLLKFGSASRMPMLDGHVIGEVRDFIGGFASPFATIDVCNPVYEHIQVRCTVKFKKGLSGGYYLNLLNQAISDFLSPWDESGYPVHFGWCIRQHNVESFILGLDYVDYVTRFSMLRISPDGDGRFALFDTATIMENGERQKDIHPKYPWSIAVPLQKHAIETTDDFTPIKPHMAGLAELEIGTTFIISARDMHGKAD